MTPVPVRRGRARVAAVCLVAALAGEGCGAGSTSTSSPVTAPLVSSATAQPEETAARSRPELVAGARWSQTALGDRLHVRPSLFGRDHASEHSRRALREALALAGPSRPLDRAQLASLTDQLRCHATFAPYKPRWDLESWRPDVGFRRTVAAWCNP